MVLTAAASTTLGPVVAAPARAATVLGVSDVAIYLDLGADEREVIAVLTADALRLPCGVVLDGATRLTTIAPLPGQPATVGDHLVRWTSRAGPVAIHAARSWTPPRVVPLGTAWAAGVAALDQAIADVGIGDIGIAPVRPADVDATLVLDLIGRGPGLTPSGDDVLAGLLLGGRAFGVPLDHLAAAIDGQADARTTALSARLLRHAMDGECVPEVAALFAALPAGGAVAVTVDAVLRLGHTSGAALVHGIVLAARLAAAPSTPRVVS